MPIEDTDISEIGIGAASWGAKVGKKTAGRILSVAMERGINLIDTAPRYPKANPGASEVIVGSLTKRFRDRFLISTKVSSEMPELPALHGGGLTKAAIVRSVELSLRRLGTPHVDFLFAHSPDPLTPINETLEAFSNLRNQGKVRWTGLSNFGSKDYRRLSLLAKLNGVCQVNAVQEEYNLLVPHKVSELKCAKRFLGALVFAYAPLAGGALAKPRPRLENSIQHSPIFQKSALEADVSQSRTCVGEEGIDFAGITPRFLRNPSVYRTLDPAQLAINWVLSSGVVDTILLGASDESQLLSALYCLDLK